MRLRPTLFFSILLISVAPLRASAISLDPSDFTAPLQLLTSQAASASAKAIGIGGEFQPLTGINPPSGPLGLEIGVATQASKVPDDFRAVLSSAGFSSSIPAVIPAARVQVNFRLGDRFALEGGWLKYQGYKLTGLAAKLKIIDPEEGFGAALRLGYSDNDLGVISSKTWTPAIIFGNKLSFTEPYFGASYSFATAKVELPITVGPTTTTFSATGKANGLTVFGGLIFDIAALQIAFEGHYSNVGVPGLSARVGMRF